jgi:hypothetical protein
MLKGTAEHMEGGVSVCKVGDAGSNPGSPAHSWRSVFWCAIECLINAVSLRRIICVTRSVPLVFETVLLAIATYKTSIIMMRRSMGVRGLELLRISLSDQVIYFVS